MNAVVYGTQYVSEETAREAEGLHRTIRELRQVLHRALAVSREALAERPPNNAADVSYIEDKIREKQEAQRRAS